MASRSKAEGDETPSTVKSPFGAKNRARLLEAYYRDALGLSTTEGWRHVYQLLLWIDSTTGLAHCYESDKSQPGKHWYPRSLAFHAWVSNELQIAPLQLAEKVDWLFRRATLDLAKQILARHSALMKRAGTQRTQYEGQSLPAPGEDPELIAVIQEALGNYLADEIPAEKWREVIQRIRQHVSLENKRKNLVGEGFEDVLASVISRSTLPGAVDVAARRALHDVPGFANVRVGEKVNKVDLVVLRPESDRRMLVTAKWSIRADREKQFPAEFSSYVSAKSDLKPFDYVLITNEYDPARLARACEMMAANSYMFADVVHINTNGLVATYGKAPESSMKRVVEYVSSGRLISLDAWIAKLTTP